MGYPARSNYLEGMEYRNDYTLADIKDAFSAGFEEGCDYGFDQGYKEPKPSLLDDLSDPF